jgi:S-adenosylmethionine hydrolase
MAIITLTTDMGLKDHYVAAVKGAIHAGFPEARIVDVSHLVQPFNNAQAAFVLRHAYPDFPKGTIHIIGVNPESDGRTPHLVVRQDGHYFIGADNGIFSLLFDTKPEAAFEITMKLDEDLHTFPVKSVFVKAACHLARGGTPETIGRAAPGVREQIDFQPAVDGDRIRAKVIYVDHYGNLVLNVKRRLFDEVGRGRALRIDLRKGEPITRLHSTYGDVPHGEKVAFFGANGLLQVAVNKAVEGVGGGAARLFGVRENDPVIIDFDNRR